MWLRSPLSFPLLLLFWQEWAAVLWVRWKLGLMLLGIVVLGGIAWFWWQLPVYDASMKILVGHAENLPAEMELLTNRAVLEAVADALPLAAPERDWAELSSRLTLTAAEQSRLIRVSYRTTSPTQATQFLQTLFVQYAAQRQALQPSARPEAALRARSETFNEKLDATTQALQQLNGATDVATQQELLLTQWYDAQTQAAAAQTERRELEQRRLALRAQLTAQPEQVETGSVTKYGAALDKMKEELLALEMQRTEARQKYQPGHRLLRDLDQRLARAQELIAQEEQNPPRERSFARNETRQRLQDDLLKVEAELAALTPREQRLTALVREYQTKLTSLRAEGFKKSDLERVQALNEEAWRRFEQKAQEAEIQAVLQQANEPPVRLVEAPVADPRPVNALRSFHVISLLLLGLVTSVGGTLLIESWQPRLRSTAGLRRRLGLEVLAILPARQSHD